MDLAALRAELENDPTGMGYAPLVNSADDIAVANLLNSLTSPGAGTVTIPVLTRGQFLLNVVAPVGANLLGATDQLKAKWTFYLDLAKASEEIHVTSPVIQGLLASLVADGIATQAEIDAVTKRVGSRAEVLFGADIKVTPEHVGAAR